MSGILLRWRIPARAVETRWRGPQGVLDAIRREGTSNLAAFVVPAAPAASVTGGDGIVVVGNDIRVNIEELPLAPGA